MQEVFGGLGEFEGGRQQVKGTSASCKLQKVIFVKIKKFKS
jgi:hypothetical protein